MSLTEFVLAFTGIVIGLGVADLLTSLHKLLRAGSKVKWDWLTLFYAAYMLFGLIIFWWWQFGYPGQGKTLTILQFLPSFLFLALAFLMAASALPDDVPAEGLDLRVFYNNTVGHRWGLLSASLASNLAAIVWRSMTSGVVIWVGIAVLFSCTFLALLALRFRKAGFHAFVLVWLFISSGFGALLYPIGP